MWEILGRRARDLEVGSVMANEPCLALQEEWQNIPQDDILNLIDGMYRRMQVVIKAIGANKMFLKTPHISTNIKLNYSAPECMLKFLIYVLHTCWKSEKFDY